MSHEHSVNTTPPGWVDMVVALVLFVLLTIGLKSLFDSAIPGLLKDDTLTQIQLSGVLFILFWAVMGNRFLKPHIDVVVSRETSSDGAEARAKARIEETALLDEQISEALREERLKLLSQRDAMLAEARQGAASELETAEGEASGKREQAKAEIEKLKGDAEQDLQGEAEKLASLVVERALSEVSSGDTVIQ